MCVCVYVSVCVSVCACACVQLTSLELQYVSPKLMACKDLELAVPGTYEPNQPVICIQRVQASLQVIPAKQRPRTFRTYGQLSASSGHSSRDRWGVGWGQ